MAKFKKVIKIVLQLLPLVALVVFAILQRKNAKPVDALSVPASGQFYSYNAYTVVYIVVMAGLIALAIFNLRGWLKERAAKEKGKQRKRLV